MDKFQKEMFDFLTREENLKGLIIAKNQYNLVVETLAKDLWNKVFSNLSGYFQDQNNWSVKFDKQISDSRSKLYLYDKELKIQKDGLPSMFFGWERLTKSYPYYGFFINLNSDEFRADEISRYILEHKHEFAHGLKGPDGGWLIWDQDNHIDFNIDNTLLNISPARVDSKADELSGMLIDLFNSMLESYNYVKRKFIK